MVVLGFDFFDFVFDSLFCFGLVIVRRFICGVAIIWVLVFWSCIRVGTLRWFVIWYAVVLFRLYLAEWVLFLCFGFGFGLRFVFIICFMVLWFVL